MNKLLVLSIAAFFGTAAHAGEIYRCVDADGAISYTNVACPDKATTQRIASYEPEPNSPMPAYAVPSEAGIDARQARETELAQARADAYAQAQADFAADQARADAQAEASTTYQPVYVPYPVSVGRHHGGHHGGSHDRGGHDGSRDLPFKPTTPIAKIGPNGEWLQH